MNTVITQSVKIATICTLLIAAQASAHDLNMWPSKFNIHRNVLLVLTGLL